MSGARMLRSADELVSAGLVAEDQRDALSAVGARYAIGITRPCRR